MSGFNSWVRNVRKTRHGLVLAISLLSMQTAQAVQVSAEQRAACTPDAYKFCAQEIPNERAVAKCMLRKRASLSLACKAVVADVEAQYKAEKGGKQASR